MWDTACVRTDLWIFCFGGNYHSSRTIILGQIEHLHTFGISAWIWIPVGLTPVVFFWRTGVQILICHCCDDLLMLRRDPLRHIGDGGDSTSHGVGRLIDDRGIDGDSISRGVVGLIDNCGGSINSISHGICGRLNKCWWWLDQLAQRCQPHFDNWVVKTDDRVWRRTTRSWCKWCKQDVTYVQACITHFLSYVESTEGAGEMTYPYDQYIFILVVTTVLWLLDWVCKRCQWTGYHLLGSVTVR